MNVYICYRYDVNERGAETWQGALLIVAETAKHASAIYQQEDWADRLPRSIELLPEVSATGSPRIIYDDEAR